MRPPPVPSADEPARAASSASTVRRQPLRQYLRSAYDRHCDRVALTSGDWKVTYGELRERSFRMAKALDDLGLPAYELVGALVGDLDTLVTIRFGTFERGNPLFILSPAITPEQGLEMLSSVRPQVVFYDPRHFPQLATLLPEAMPEVHMISTAPGGELEQQLGAVAGEPSRHRIPADRLSALGFSSGTTGRPKGLTTSFGAQAVCCHRFLAVMARLGLDRPAPFLNAIPIQGAGSGILPPALYNGMTVHILRRWNAQEALDLLEAKRIEGMFATPSMIIDLLDVPDLEKWDLSALRAVIYGSAIMPAQKLEEAVRRLGPIFLQGYGMAEVLPPLSVLWPEEHGSRERPADREALSSAGRPWEGVELRVVDEWGQDLPPGEIGEILVASDTMTPGYWDDHERTRLARRGRWWRTLDLGYFDLEGRVSILCREADLLHHEGRALYPRQIEEVCHDHPAVKEACAVAAADGGLVVAVSLRQRAVEDPTAVAEELAERIAGAFLLPPPRMLVLEEIPRSALGKILHRQVREQLASLAIGRASKSRSEPLQEAP